jgi:hypothetical protein
MLLTMVIVSQNYIYLYQHGNVRVISWIINYGHTHLLQEIINHVECNNHNISLIFGSDVMENTRLLLLGCYSKTLDMVELMLITLTLYSVSDTGFIKPNSRCKRSWSNSFKSIFCWLSFLTENVVFTKCWIFWRFLKISDSKEIINHVKCNNHNISLIFGSDVTENTRLLLLGCYSKTLDIVELILKYVDPKCIDMDLTPSTVNLFRETVTPLISVCTLGNLCIVNALLRNHDIGAKYQTNAMVVTFNMVDYFTKKMSVTVINYPAYYPNIIFRVFKEISEYSTFCEYNIFCQEA